MTVIFQATSSKQITFLIFPSHNLTFPLYRSAITVPTLHHTQLHSVRISITETIWQWTYLLWYGKLNPGSPPSHFVGLLAWFRKSRFSLFPIHTSTRKVQWMLAVSRWGRFLRSLHTSCASMSAGCCFLVWVTGCQFKPKWLIQTQELSLPLG